MGITSVWTKRYISLFIFLYKKYSWVTGKDSYSFVRFLFGISVAIISFRFVLDFFIPLLYLIIWSVPLALAINSDKEYIDQVKAKAEPDKIYSMPDTFGYRSFTYRRRQFNVAWDNALVLFDLTFAIISLITFQYLTFFKLSMLMGMLFFICLSQAGTMVYLQSPHKSLYSRAKAKAKHLKNNFKIPSLLPPPMPTPARVVI